MCVDADDGGGDGGELNGRLEAGPVAVAPHRPHQEVAEQRLRRPGGRLHQQHLDVLELAQAHPAIERRAGGWRPAGAQQRAQRAGTGELLTAHQVVGGQRLHRHQRALGEGQEVQPRAELAALSREGGGGVVERLFLEGERALEGLEPPVGAAPGGPGAPAMHLVPAREQGVHHRAGAPQPPAGRVVQHLVAERGVASLRREHEVAALELRLGDARRRGRERGVEPQPEPARRERAQRFRQRVEACRERGHLVVGQRPFDRQPGGLEL